MSTAEDRIEGLQDQLNEALAELRRIHDDGDPATTYTELRALYHDALGQAIAETDRARDLQTMLNAAQVLIARQQEELDRLRWEVLPDWRKREIGDLKSGVSQ